MNLPIPPRSKHDWDCLTSYMKELMMWGAIGRDLGQQLERDAEKTSYRLCGHAEDATGTAFLYRIDFDQ